MLRPSARKRTGVHPWTEQLGDERVNSRDLTQRRFFRALEASRASTADPSGTNEYAKHGTSDVTWSKNSRTKVSPSTSGAARSCARKARRKLSSDSTGAVILRAVFTGRKIPSSGKRSASAMPASPCHGVPYIQMRHLRTKMMRSSLRTRAADLRDHRRAEVLFPRRNGR